MSQKKLLCLLISFILGQFFLSCMSPTSPNLLPTPSTEDSASPENTSLPLITNIPSSTPLATSTASVITLQEANRVVQGVYKNNGGCQLPCYWKITPGETSWTDVSTFVASVRGISYQFGTSKIARYDISFEDLDTPIVGISPRIWVENGLVKAIGINSRWVSQDFDYTLSGLLQSLGVPDEIWISPIAESLDGQPYYHLELFYPSKGILVGLLGNASQEGQYLSLCPQDIFSRSPFPPTLLLWNPKEKVNFDSDFGKKLVDDDLGLVMDDYRLLQMVSANKLTNQEFYNTFSDPNTKACIDVLPVR
jgi:hypothetical protein